MCFVTTLACYIIFSLSTDLVAYLIRKMVEKLPRYRYLRLPCYPSAKLLEGVLDLVLDFGLWTHAFPELLS